MKRSCAGIIIINIINMGLWGKRRLTAPGHMIAQISLRLCSSEATTPLGKEIMGAQSAINSVVKKTRQYFSSGHSQYKKEEYYETRKPTERKN